MLNLILASTGYKCVRTADEDAGDQIQCEVLVRGCHEDMPEGLLYVQFFGSFWPGQELWSHPTAGWHIVCSRKALLL